LFDGVLARGRARLETSDEAWLRAMLEAEAALARAAAGAGAVSLEDADAIGRACRPEAFDLGQLGRDSAASGNPVVPLVRAIEALIDGPAARSVHYGATSQDILDTAAMLVASRAIDAILADLDGAADAAAGLARSQRDVPMVARTLLQHALPTTFGLKAAGWLSGLDAAAGGLRRVRATGLAVELGGAAGTLAAFGDFGPRIVELFAAELGLSSPPIAWHTERTRIGELAAALGVAAGAIAKPAVDIVLMAQTEVGEVRDAVPGRGGSSSLPNKHNPIAAVSALAAARQAPGLVATLLGSMAGEHERAAGAWHAEWQPLNALLVAVGSASAWLRDGLEHLEVDPARLAANLAQTGGLLLAERVAAALTPAVGRARAGSLVAAACQAALAKGGGLADVLNRQPEVSAILAPAEVSRLLDPTTYLGQAGQLVDRALADHAARLPGQSE